MSEINQQKKQPASKTKFDKKWLTEGSFHWQGIDYQVERNPNWRYTSRDNKFKFQAFLLNGEILVARFTGEVALEHIKSAYSIIHSLFSENKNIQHYLLDLLQVRFINYYTRLFFIKQEKGLATSFKQRFLLLSETQLRHLLIFKKLDPDFFHHTQIIHDYPEFFDSYLGFDKNGVLLSEKEDFNYFPVSQSNYQESNLASLSKEELIKMIQEQEQAKIEAEQYHQSKMMEVLKSIGQMSWQEISEPEMVEIKEDQYGYHYLLTAISILHKDIFEIASELNAMNLKLGSKVVLQKQQLTEKEARLTSLIENTPDMICSLNRDYQVLIINKSYQEYIKKMYGVVLNQGDNIFEKIKVSNETFWKETYQRAFSGEMFTREVMVEHQGEKVYFDFFFSPIFSNSKNNEISGISFFARDVTKQKNIENQLKIQNEELQKINEELDRFVYSASHDLRAPLSSVLGLINLSKMENLSGELSTYLGLMDKSVRKLDSFIKDITHHSRNIRLDIIRNEINFNEIIQESFDNLNFMINSDKIKKIIEINQNVPFYSDENRLSVILNNIISNAIRYSNPYQEEPFIKISIQCDEKEMKMNISDNGQGIDKDHIDKIFDMFYRATNNDAGSGLGLYIVKETVNKLNGKIIVESVLGEGTDFCIVLPNIN